MLTLYSVASIKIPEHMSVRHGNASLPCDQDQACHQSTNMACTTAACLLINPSDDSWWSQAERVEHIKHLKAFEAGALMAQGIHQAVVAHRVMVRHLAALAACKVDVGLVLCGVQA